MDRISDLESNSSLMEEEGTFSSLECDSYFSISGLPTWVLDYYCTRTKMKFHTMLYLPVGGVMAKELQGHIQARCALLYWEEPVENVISECVSVSL